MKNARRKIERPKFVDPASFKYGVMLAAEVASGYDKTNSHPYLVSDCILGKLNLLKGKPRKNPDAETVAAVLTRIERKLESIEGEVRFATRHTNRKRSTSVRL